ncbi:MAG: T9SS type A sorting domain-containing protein, partial [Flavitalea sp.]
SLKKDIVYYRLRVTDKDGSVTLSKIVPLLFGSDGLRLIAVSPTIASDNTVLTIASSEKASVHFSLTSGEGKLIRSFTRVIEEGSTAITVNAYGLSAGMYFISAYSANGKSNVIRLVKK